MTYAGHSKLRESRKGEFVTSVRRWDRPAGMGPSVDAEMTNGRAYPFCTLLASANCSKDAKTVLCSGQAQPPPAQGGWWHSGCQAEGSFTSHRAEATSIWDWALVRFVWRAVIRTQGWRSLGILARGSIRNDYCVPLFAIEIGRIRHEWLHSECNWYNSSFEKFSTSSFCQYTFVTMFQDLF